MVLAQDEAVARSPPREKDQCRALLRDHLRREPQDSEVCGGRPSEPRPEQSHSNVQTDRLYWAALERWHPERFRKEKASWPLARGPVR